VFLIDVSGSMDQEDKLPLLKNAFSQLVKELGEDDRVSIVVYAGKARVVLDSVPGNETDVILDAIESLEAGGSTAGADGINLAYGLAAKNFREGGNNRVILATDGDCNVGPSSMEELYELIAEKRDSGIFLSVMGFGMGNIKDNRMELLADKGNGNYSYIDSPREAKKVLVDEMAGTLLTIARDVKIQLEFNPCNVKAYRLIGYENRALRDRDFKDDSIDAGELGAGHSVTAIYEIVPAGRGFESKYTPDIKYGTVLKDTGRQFTDELAEIRLRYKEPDGDESREIKRVVSVREKPGNTKSKDFWFAAAVAEFGMILRDSEFKGNSDIESVLRLAKMGLGEDKDGYRSEFISMVENYNVYYAYIR
jgi:Ca-activated chloride channel family protein